MYQMVEDKIFGMGFIGLEPGRLYKIGQSPKMKDQTASGNPLLLNSAEAPLTALSLYGWSKQSGTPSPESPVPIVSAGDSGAINVTVQGGNLVDLNVSATMPGNSTYSYDGYTATLTTILTEEDLTDLAPANNRIYRSVFIQLGDDFAGKTVTISYDSAEIMFDMEQIIGLVYTDDSGTTIYNHLASNIESKSLTIAIPDTATNIRFRIILIEKNSFAENLTPGTYTAKINGIMLALGASKLPWMPYKLPQTLTLQTPNGLPGIPVDSGGNYTDADGQQWVCDEVDFARGVYVQRVGKINVNLVDSYNSNEGFGLIINPDNLLNTGLRVPILSNYFQFDKNIKNDGTGFAYSNGIRLYYALGSVEAFNEWLSQNDVVVYYPFATPIETPLSAEQIAAYKALHTYTPNTTVSNDAGAWMKMGYKTNEL